MIQCWRKPGNTAASSATQVFCLLFFGQRVLRNCHNASVQTQRVLGDERFKSWRYRHDPTHIVFFAEASFRALAARWQADLCFPHADVAVFTKP